MLKLILTDITPAWLRTPALLATGLEDKLAPTLFRSLVKGCGLPHGYAVLGSGVLGLFQYSMDTLDGLCGHDFSSAKVHLHDTFGEERAAVWAFGLGFQPLRLLARGGQGEGYDGGGLEPGMAFKVARLYVAVTLRRLEGQHEELAALGADSADYARIARLKTAVASVAFPVSLYTLLSTGDLPAAMAVLQSAPLLELGRWFHAEQDFRDQFELTRQGNSAITEYTVFIDLVAKKFPAREFRFPRHGGGGAGVGVVVKELLDEHDIFYEYVVLREKYVKGLEAEFKAEAPADVVGHAQQLAVAYFRARHELCAYAMMLPDLSAIVLHPRSMEINTKLHAWARQFPPHNIVYQFVFQYDFNEWLNYSYPFIAEVDIVVELHKLCVIYVLMDDVMERSVHLIDDIEPVLQDCMAPGFLEGRVGHRPIVWSDPTWSLLPMIDFLLRQLIEHTTRIQQPDMLGDFKLFKKALMWQRAIRAIRELVKKGTFTVDEYNRIRNNESELFIWCGFAAAYYGKDFMNDFDHTYTLDYCFASFLQNELVSYGNDIILNNALPLPRREKLLLNSVDNYRLFAYPGESVQDTFFRLNAEEKRIVNWLHSFKGTELWYLSLVFFGFAYHTLSDRYARSMYKSKNTAICLMH